MTGWPEVMAQSALRQEFDALHGPRTGRNDQPILRESSPDGPIA